MRTVNPLDIARKRALELAGEIELAMKAPTPVETFDLMIQASVELGAWFERYDAEVIAPFFLPAFMRLGLLLDALEKRLATEGGPNAGYMLSVMAEIKLVLLQEVEVSKEQGTIAVNRKIGS